MISLKLVHITPQEPSRDSGGGIGVLQTTLSICTDDNDVTYIGPKITDPIISGMYKEVIFLERDKNVIRRLFALIRGVSSSLYYAWKNLKIDFSKYDFCIMDFTKLDFVVDGKKMKCPLIVKAHNVEFDYSHNDYIKNKKINKWVVSKLSYAQENTILNKATHIFALTEQDKTRLITLYGDTINGKISLNPVALEEKDINIVEKGTPLKLLITGSLWYGENANGVMWFIDNVLSKLGKSVHLTVAGARPNEDLIRKVQNYENVEIVASPESMDDFFHDTNVIIAPVFSGAGMKVKVAEALAYGKVLIGTHHAIIGYDVIDGENAYIANNADEFILKLKYIDKMTDSQYQDICRNAYMLFKKNHSVDSSRKQWRKVMEKV